MNDEDAIFALAQSELAHRWWSQSNQTEFYARNHMLQISRALSKVEPGQLVRMRLIEGQRLEIYPIQFTYIEEMSWG